MKRFIAVLTAFIMVFAFSLNIFAESININSEISAVISYYTDNAASIQEDAGLLSARTVIAFSAVNAYKQSGYTESPDKTDAKELSDAIFVRLAQKKDVKGEVDGFYPLNALKNMQTENGSIGNDTESHIRAMIALSAAQKKTHNTLYSESKAVEYLLSLQANDGSFGSVYVTALALTALTPFDDDSKVSESTTRAVKFIYNNQNEDGTFSVNGNDDFKTLAAAICGLTDIGEDVQTDTWRNMVTAMLQYRHADGSYKSTLSSDGSFDHDANLSAIEALDAVKNDRSIYLMLMKNGTVTDTGIENLLPVLIGLGALALLSVVFWLYILFGKRKPSEVEIEMTKNSVLFKNDENTDEEKN